MKILTLDLSTKSTGYAESEDGKIIDCGTISYNHESVYERIDYIERVVKAFAKDVDFIVIEELSVMRNGTTVKLLAGLQVGIEVILNRLEKLYTTVRPSEWRKVAEIKTKNRKEQKQEAIEKCKELFNIDCNEDEAEACLMTIWATEKAKEIENVKGENHDR